MKTQASMTFPQAPRVPTVRVLSCGGGLDSFAMLLWALIAGVRIDVVVFCDVADPEGLDPGEWPGTYRHLREVVMPLCAAHGIEFVWMDTTSYPIRDARSLHAWMLERGQIPVAGPKRLCTTIAKVERFEAWMTDRFPGQVVEVLIGYEAGEEGRAERDPNSGTGRKHNPGEAVRVNRFPLMELGLCRCRCEAICRAIGFPVPRKSACVFCPYGSKGDWQTYAAELPAYFAATAQLEAAKKPTAGKGRKLSIMAFRSFEKRPAPKRTKLRILVDRLGHSYSAPTVAEFIEGSYKAKPEACGVCGAEQRATKATACSYLDEAA